MMAGERNFSEGLRIGSPSCVKKVGTCREGRVDGGPVRAGKVMVKGKGHDRGTLAKGKASSTAAFEAQKGWAAWYLDNCKASLDKRQKLFEEKYSAFKQGSIEDVDCKAWLYIAKFAYLLGLDILCSPKCPTRTDHFVSTLASPE